MPTKADSISKIKAQIKAEKDPNVKAALEEKLALLEGKPVEGEYLDTGMSAGEYKDAKVASGRSNFPVEGTYPLVLGKPYADKVARVDGSESWEVVKIPWQSMEEAPFESKGEFTAFRANPNTGKSSLKTVLEAVGAPTVEREGRVLFRPADVEGKKCRGYFKIPVNKETGKKDYFDPATGEYLPSRIANLVTILPFEEKGKVKGQKQTELPV